MYVVKIRNYEKDSHAIEKDFKLKIRHRDNQRSRQLQLCENEDVPESRGMGRMMMMMMRERSYAGAVIVCPALFNALQIALPFAL